MDLWDAFLKVKKHPHPRYGCVCGKAHMGQPEIVLYHFLERQYGKYFTERFFVGHYWVYGAYHVYVACKRCGGRLTVTWSPESFEKLQKFIFMHRCTKDKDNDYGKEEELKIPSIDEVINESVF